MPLILGMDSSAKTATAALCKDGVLLAQTQLNTPFTHSQTMLPMVQALLDSAKIRVEDLDAVAVSSGPGSFTGLRIGISAVKALAYALNKPCAGVSTLEAIAMNGTGLNSIFCPVMDARCAQVYTALFQSGECVERLWEDEAIAIADLEKKLNTFGRQVMLMGDGAALVYEALKDKADVVMAPPLLRYQNGYGVCLAAEKLAAEGKLCEAARLMPVYLRLPQAERERLAREKAAGSK